MVTPIKCIFENWRHIKASNYKLHIVRQIWHILTGPVKLPLPSNLISYSNLASRQLPNRNISVPLVSNDHNTLSISVLYVQVQSTRVTTNQNSTSSFSQWILRDIKGSHDIVKKNSSYPVTYMLNLSFSVMKAIVKSWSELLILSQEGFFCIQLRSSCSEIMLQLMKVAIVQGMDSSTIVKTILELIHRKTKVGLKEGTIIVIKRTNSTHMSESSEASEN